MQVNVFRCPQCSFWVVIPHLEAQQTRVKTCGYCDATFVFRNSNLVTREVPKTLANRGYFDESEVNPREK